MSVLQLVVSAGIPSLISGMVLSMVARHLSRKDKRDEARAAAAREENILIMENVQAVGHLAQATALVLQREGRTNGETKTALLYYARARDKTNDYLLRQNAAANH